VRVVLPGSCMGHHFRRVLIVDGVVLSGSSTDSDTFEMPLRTGERTGWPVAGRTPDAQAAPPDECV